MSEDPSTAEASSTEEAGSQTRGPLRRRALVGALGIGLMLIAGLILVRSGWLERGASFGLAWAREAGWAGGLVMAASYVGCVVALLPSFPLTIGAGVVWGPLRATVMVLPVATLGCTLAFLCGRYLFRAPVEARVREDPRFVAIDRAIAEQGFVLVFLLRVSPVLPYNLLNYALGVTRVGLGSYVLGSMLGMIPVTFMWAQIGATAGELSMHPDVPASPEMKAIRVASLLATVVVVVLVTRLAKRALRSAVPETD